MGDYLAAVGIVAAVGFSVAALIVAIWRGQDSSMHLEQPDPEQMQMRAKQKAAIDDLLTRQQELTTRVLELESEMAELRVWLSDFEAGTTQLMAQLEALKVEPAWRPKKKRTRPEEAQDSQGPALYKKIADQFSDAEIDELAMNAGVPAEEFGGDTKTAKALELVQYAQRHGSLENLIAAAKKARPRGKF